MWLPVKGKVKKNEHSMKGKAAEEKALLAEFGKVTLKEQGRRGEW